MERNYIVKISLYDLQPQISRVIKTKSDISLSHLHHVIQLSVGWSNSHLYEFVYHGLMIGNPTLMDDQDVLSDKFVTLSNILKQKGDRLFYKYDFGSSWIHEICLADIVYEQKTAYPPVCLGGNRNGPPEDCGGKSGYLDILEALSNRNSEKSKEVLNTLEDGTYDPELININNINKSLRRLDRYVKEFELTNGL